MSQALSQQVVQQIANEINAKAQQVNAAIQLLDGGATVPFIARYRKELTGSLDDQQLRVLFQRVTYLRELQQRRDSIRQSLSEQNQLSDALNQALNQANTKSELEDIYLPFKPKRNNKALLAKQAGLAPLFEQLLCQSHQDPTKLASKYCKANSDFDQSDKVLEGIKYLLIEQLQTQPEVRSQLRQLLTKTAVLQSKVVTSKAAEASKFRDYFDYQEAWRKIPSHRALAMFRGKGLGFLRLKLDLLDPPAWPQHPVQRLLVDVLAHAFPKLQRSTWLSENLEWAWKQKLRPALENELLSQLRQQAEEEAIQVFAKNLHALLMAAPAGPLVTIGLDPGIRTGVKVVVLDATGKLLEYCTIYPHQPKKQWQSALAKLQQLIKRHQVSLIAIGNGTGSRETQDLVKQALQEPEYAAIQQLIVSEAGASVYSASELAAAEFPELDVSIRGAVSIARRLQDPLAELVKIDPKAIGVGQYQHDVNQKQLSQQLAIVIEDCVNAVGVDLNTASAPLLQHVAGLNSTLSHNIVSFRDEHGPFKSRAALKKVPRLGPKAFEQAAAFLRIMDASNPLDSSAVHPEAYSLVKQLSADQSCSVKKLIGNSEQLSQVNPETYLSEQFGLPTIRDILAELARPGRDPRPEFVSAKFKAELQSIKDLEVGMKLEGVVTNITNFGAFVDLGVHQDGLVHISQLADKFISDPHQLVKTGEIIEVTVIEVDIARSRIALSCRSQADSNATRSAKEQAAKPVATKPMSTKASDNNTKNSKPNRSHRQNSNGNNSVGNSAMRDAFSKLKGKS